MHRGSSVAGAFAGPLSRPFSRLRSRSASRAVSCALASVVFAVWLAPGVSAADAPLVIVVSMDGVRHDYPERTTLPGMARMEAEGVRAERLLPVFPASTFPNHVALATGTHVDRHGIVDNRFYDRERNEVFAYGNDAGWIEAEPLWVAAERQGVRSAVLFWVGSETDWRGVGATYRVAPFSDTIGEEEKLAQIRSWLDLPAAERPQLIMTWWHGADRDGHRTGPDSPEVVEALVEQDGFLQRLQAEIDERDAWATTTLVLVSDHGMTTVTEEIDAAAPLEEAGIEARLIPRGSHLQVFLADPGQIDAAERALEKVAHATVYRREAIPDALRFRHPTRSGDLALLAAPPYYFPGDGFLYWLESTLQWAFGVSKGMHGYDPQHPDMGAIFFAMGRGVPKGAELGVVRSIDVAPTVAKLLGIDPPKQAEGVAIPALSAAKPN